MIFHDYDFQVTEINGKFRILEKEEFEKTVRGSVCTHIGFVVERPELRIRGLSGCDVIQANLEDLRRAWKRKDGDGLQGQGSDYRSLGGHQDHSF
jgi:hypothetical protein